MENKYSYELTEPAIDDAQAIFKYIAIDLASEENALSLQAMLVDAMEAACTFPQKHGLLNDPKLAFLGYRKIIVKKYLVIFRIDENQKKLYVVRIFHTTQNYLKEL